MLHEWKFVTESLGLSWSSLSTYLMNKRKRESEKRKRKKHKMMDIIDQQNNELQIESKTILYTCYKQRERLINYAS